MPSVFARAPANIALIKYMGKSDFERNLPANPSLSLTLDALCTVVEVSTVQRSEPKVFWIPEPPRISRATAGLPAGEVLRSPELSESGVARILKHAEKIRSECLKNIFPSLEVPTQSEASYQSFELRTTNTFPLASGIASSASSFAAVTLAMAAMCAKNPETFVRALEAEPRLQQSLSSLSRTGSGSSCRSFQGPWVLWEDENVRRIENSKIPPLTDLILLVERKPKRVSSSEAHRRVLTSPLWPGRAERASKRCTELQEALSQGNLHDISKISWADMWEMHSLFHTSREPFTYWEPLTLEVLRWIAPFVQAETSQKDKTPLKDTPSMKDILLSNDEDPPIVTLDAGANVHLLVQSSEADLWRERLRERFPTLEILQDSQGEGARVLKVDFLKIGK